MFNIVSSSVIIFFFPGKILARSKADTDFGSIWIIPRLIHITQSTTEGLVLLFLFPFQHSAHRSDTAGMLVLWFPVFRNIPLELGYLQWPQQKTSLIASPPQLCTPQAMFTYHTAIHYNMFQHLPPHMTYLIDPFYAAPRLAVLYSGKVNSTHCFFSWQLVNIPILGKIGDIHFNPEQGKSRCPSHLLLVH